MSGLVVEVFQSFWGSARGGLLPDPTTYVVQRGRFWGQSPDCDPQGERLTRSRAIRYWITSSAVANSVSGMVRPSVLAVLRLMTSSNLVGFCTGSSAGLSPLRTRLTY